MAQHSSHLEGAHSGFHHADHIQTIGRNAFTTSKGREGIGPDLPLPGRQATGSHGGARVGKEVAEGLVDLRPSCGGERGLQTTGWQRRESMRACG